MKTDFDVWYKRLVELYEQHGFETEHYLASPRYFKKKHFEAGRTPEQVVVSSLLERLEQITSSIHTLEPSRITDTDRLEWVFNETTSFIPSDDSIDSGIWCVDYITSLSLTEVDANFRDDIDALMKQE